MRVIGLQARNFQILQAVNIRPGEGPVVIGGKNEQGKSSVMDAIWVALKGRAVAAPVPIREGEEKCVLVLEIGEGEAIEYAVHRTFTRKEGNTYTDTIKVLDDRGRIVPSPQRVLDELMGAIGFDPFAFTKMKPEDQAEQLLQLVPLPIDLEEFDADDKRDYATRRDRSRDADALKGQLAAMPQFDDAPTEPVDRDAILQKLGSAADTNSAIERERMAREERLRRIGVIKADSTQAAASAVQLRAQAAQLIREAEGREADATSGHAEADRLQGEYDALPPLDEPADTAALQQQLRDAEAANAKLDANKRRDEVQKRHDALAAEVVGFTNAMEERERERQEALKAAKMPVPGLGFAVNDKGKPVVTFKGLPFSQASTAAQIRASTAIAMAANPELRVLRIKDGSLLDEDAMAMITEMAAADDFQLWIEVVGTGGVGIIIENGEVKGAPPAAEADQAEGKPAAKKAPTKKGKGSDAAAEAETHAALNPGADKLL
jgi:hypothetical protein